MIILATTTDKLDLISGQAVTLDVHVSYGDYASGAVTFGKQNTAISTATTTDILAAPGASTTRNAKTINVRNKSASSPCDVTVRFNQNGTAYELHKVTLAAGDVLEYIEGVGWFTVTAPTTRFYADAVGNSADVPANAADTYILGMLLGGRLKQGSQIAFCLRMTKTAAGTATPTWIIRVGTAGTTSDTARITFTGAAQTAATDTGMVDIVLTVGTAGASGVLIGSLEMQHNGTTTGFMNGAQGQSLVGTSAAHDLTGATTRIGLSINPGASGVWTHQLVTMTAIGLAA